MQSKLTVLVFSTLLLFALSACTNSGANPGTSSTISESVASSSEVGLTLQSVESQAAHLPPQEKGKLPAPLKSVIFSYGTSSADTQYTIMEYPDGKLYLSATGFETGDLITYPNTEVGEALLLSITDILEKYEILEHDSFSSKEDVDGGYYTSAGFVFADDSEHAFYADLNNNTPSNFSEFSSEMRALLEDLLPEPTPEDSPE